MINSAALPEKTVIHPNQISVVNKVYQVTRSDFNDAKQF